MGLPVLLKDLIAVEHGANGIIASNHGGDNWIEPLQH
jgi:hypothetical protein